jgi:hypothetical protein
VHDAVVPKAGAAPLAGVRPSWLHGRVFTVPEDFLHRPFSRAEALDKGITRGVLQGRHFRRLHDAVWCHVDHELSFADRILAARLALPPEARTTGLTRLQEHGIDFGARSPLHFVVVGDLHLALDGVFLHRTAKMPPHDEDGVSIEAAYVASCADACLIDAIKLGSYLLNREMLDGTLLEKILAEEKWRRGAAETAYVIPWLDGRCRSMPEAELVAYVVASGLPAPGVNHKVEIAPGVEVTPDLWFEKHAAAVEYEGSQHQVDRAQYNADIDRYAAYRKHAVAYELVTKERMRTPKTTVRRVHAMLVDRGYDGLPPEFGPVWDSLLQPLRELARPRVPRQR